MIPRHTIETILSASKIEEVVGDFVNLKRRGSNLIGLCPFHNEKTPSFNVSPARGIYKCFGCGKAGNPVNFIMEHEQYSYPEALRYLAAKYNIEVEEEERSPEYTQEQQLRESLLVVSEFAARYFKEQLLHTDEGKSVGGAYFDERGFTDKTIETFQLGYAPEGWHAFTDRAIAEGFKLEFLEKSGLTIVNGERKMDRFHGRVIFPIHTITGKVIAFGARILKTDQKAAKYLNSPESEIYHKSKILYGIYFAKKSIVAKDECFLVEGYTDVISLHQSGIENVVASSGTALTQDQIRLISRYTSNITVLYDGDSAGIKASLRGIDLILAEGLNVKVVLFPDGHDPDSFARAHDTYQLQEYLSTNAQDFIRFKTSMLMEGTAGDPIKKAGLIRDIMETIALIPDPIIRSTYTRECSTLMDIGEQILIAELNKILRKSVSAVREQPEDTYAETPEIAEEEETITHYDSSEFQEYDLLRLAMNYANENIYFPHSDDEETHDLQPVSERVVDYIVHEVSAENIVFENPVYDSIFREMESTLHAGNSFTADTFVNHQNVAIQIAAAGMLSLNYTLSERWSDKGIYVTLESDLLYKAVTSSIYSWKNKVVTRMIRQIGEKIKATDDPDKIDELLKEQIHLDQVKKMISEKLGITVLR
ncbi:MAG TPA: DNA primase [Bacteroidia bacterium]|nr:DNA primase [Bacteroidia bacterium]